MNKIILIILIIFIFPLNVVTAATINVPGDQSTIQAGIDAAVDGDVVLLADGTYTGVGNFDIIFKGKSITIQSVNGPDNCIVDCQQNGRGFLVSNHELVTFDGLTIKNGDPGDNNHAEKNYGGGIYADSSEIVIVNCIFDGNSAIVGGAVFSYSSAFTNCTFMSNNVSAKGGAVYSSHATFSNCTFTSNKAYKGGAVFSTFSCTFTNCILTNNDALNDGGAVCTSSDVTSTFINCSFLNNNATSGGAVNLPSGSSSFTGCTFTSNIASNGGAVVADITSFTDCIFKSNSASSDGGAVFSYFSTLTNCTFTDNGTSSGNGGAVFSHFSNLTDCEFTYNSAMYGGGAVYVSDSSSFTNCTFTNNSTSSGNGGAVFSVSTNFFGCIFTDNNAVSNGGAVYSSADKSSDLYTFTNCIFNCNCASKGGAVTQSSSTYTFTNCLLANNCATNGGAVYIPYYSSSTFINCTFTRNNATDTGGAIWCNTKSSPTNFMIIKNCILWEDTASKGSFFGNNYEIYYKGKFPAITFSNIQGNFSGNGNIASEPLFIDPVNNNLHLQHTSPCIDEGTQVDAPVKDLDGHPRPIGSGFDMGAYECQYIATNQLPIISSFKATPLSGQLPLYVTFTCVAFDPDGGDIEEYQWDFNDDGVIDKTSSDNTVGYTYATAGSYSSICTVVDDEKGISKSDIVKITVTDSLYIEGDYNYYLPYYSSSNNYWTGLGLANQNRDNINNLQVTIFDSCGKPLTAENKTMSANGQDAFPVAPQLNSNGWMWVNSHQPLSGLAFLGSGGTPSLMADISFISKLSTYLVIPHIAQDSSWDTTIFICNPNNEDVSVILKYIDKTGVEQEIQNYTILTHGSGKYLLSKVFSDKIPLSGKVEINASYGIAAFALYTDKKSGGSYYAGINAESCE